MYLFWKVCINTDSSASNKCWSLAIWDDAQALAKKKLFTLDYHDRLLGYVQRINDLKTSQCYATRTLFFLTSQGILKPVAIELSLPAKNDGDQPTARVICPPPKDSTKNWAWELAKAHVLSNDASFHQVISHWYDHISLKTFKLVLRFSLSLMHFYVHHDVHFYTKKT